MKDFKWPKHSILAIAVIATWIKTVIVYETSFDMKIENAMQLLILFINPLSFLLFFYGLSLFLKSQKARNRYIIGSSILLALVVYGNVAFYRFYNDFVTLPVLFQTSNFGELGTSAATIISWMDLFYFVDVLLIMLTVKLLPKKKNRYCLYVKMHVKHTLS